MFSVVAAPVINKFEALVLAPVTVQGWCNGASSAENRSIGKVVQSRRRPLLAPSPG